MTGYFVSAQKRCMTSALRKAITNKLIGSQVSLRCTSLTRES